MSSDDPSSFFLSKNADEIRSLIKESLYLSKDDNLQISLFKLRNICEDFFRISVTSSSTTTTSSANLSKCLSNLEKESLALWNIIVLNCDKYSQECIATVNYLVSTVLRQITNSTYDLSINKKINLIKITTTTSRSLLDCDQVDRAQQILHHSTLIFDSLPDLEPDFKKTVIKYKFFNEMSRIEVSIRNGKHKEALVHVEETKHLLANLHENCRIYLINFSYNIGLEFYYDKSYENSIIWLRSAFQIGLDCEYGDRPQFNSCITLNLLAEVYLNWNEYNYWEKALHAIQLSEKYGESDKLLKLKIILCAKETENEILHAFTQWIQSKPNDSSAFTVINYVIKYGCFTIALNVLLELETKLSQENNSGKFIHYFLKNLETECHFDSARTILSKFQTGNKIILSFHEACAISDLCLDKGQKYHKNLNYSQSIFWYNFSEYFLSYITENQTKMTKNIKIIRCKCLSYIQMQNVKNAVIEWEKINSKLKKNDELNESIDFFLEFQVAFLTQNNSSAVESIKKLDSLKNSTKLEKILCLSVKQALKYENSENSKISEFIISLLESIIQHTDNNILFISVTKILLRMRLQAEEFNENLCTRLFAYLDAVYQRIITCKSTKHDNISKWLEIELQWFSKFSWNLALKCSTSPQHIFSSFFICSKFLSLSSLTDEPNFVKTVTTLLLTCASGLQLAENYTETEEKETLYLQITHLIEKCESLILKFVSENVIQNVKVNAMKKSVLLYKFETYIRLNHSSTADIFDQILSIEDMDIVSLEKLAAIIIKSGEKFFNLRIRILEMFISKLKTSEPLNLVRISCIYRSLISEFAKNNSNLCLSNGKFWECVETAVEFILCQQNYPEIEVLWLMVCVWNVGVSYLLQNQPQISRKWCILASKLLIKLPTASASYQTKIQSVLDSHNWN